MTWDNKQCTKTYFNNVIFNYFPPEYANYNLYDKLRCGIIHALLPKEGVILTNTEDHRTESDGILYISCSRLVKDFKEACRKICSETKHVKLKLPICEINITKDEATTGRTATI